jgi:hypothetical protein
MWTARSNEKVAGMLARAIEGRIGIVIRVSHPNPLDTGAAAGHLCHYTARTR